MTIEDIRRLRLQNQRLVGTKFKTPEAAVEWLGAVQAQDYPAAKWGVGLRVSEATDTLIESAFNDGRIIRTHVMRPTWHFILPEDLLWMQELTAKNVKKLMRYYNRKLELTDELFAKTNRLIVDAVKDDYVTRQDLKKLLEGIGVKTDVQRLAHIIMWAELEGLICSGPRLGKQFSYALVEKRIQKSKKVEREEGLALLALKYVRSHGPVQIKDFSWWSGLKMKDAEEAINSIASKLHREVFEGREYWWVQGNRVDESKKDGAFLLSIYDEYTIAYKDRSAMSKGGDIELMIQMGNALTAVMILDGGVVGTWKRTIKKDMVEVRLCPFKKIKKSEIESVEKAVERYAQFCELTSKIEYVN